MIRKGKYNAVRVELDGRKFASKREAHVYGKLKLMKIAAVIVDFQCQVPFSLDVCGQKICKYYADFVVHYPSGRYEVWDAKGMKTPVYKLKKKLMAAIHKIDIVEV